jgi:hypothetical protein
MEQKEKDKQGRVIPCREWMYQGQPGVPTPASEAHPVAGCEAHMKGEPCLMGRNGKPKYFVHPDEAEWGDAVAAEAARVAEKEARKAAMPAPKPAAAAAPGPLWRQPAAAAAGPANAAGSWRNAGNAPKRNFARLNEKIVIPPATGFYRQRRQGKLFPLGDSNNEYEPSWADVVEAEEAAARAAAAAEQGGRRSRSSRKTQKKRKSKSKRSRSRK